MDWFSRSLKHHSMPFTWYINLCKCKICSILVTPRIYCHRSEDFLSASSRTFLGSLSSALLVRFVNLKRRIWMQSTFSSTTWIEKFSLYLQLGQGFHILTSLLYWFMVFMVSIKTNLNEQTYFNRNEQTSNRLHVSHFWKEWQILAENDWLSWIMELISCFTNVFLFLLFAFKQFYLICFNPLGN